MEKIDRKFRFVAVNPCNGKVYTEDNAIIFCAKDKALPAAINAYITECLCLGADSAHIESVTMLLERVKRFQEQAESRVPDTVGDCEIDRCIGGKGL